MKKIRTIIFILVSCSSFAQVSPWSQKASMDGVARHRPFTFTIGQRGYLGCGWNGVTMYGDFWEYDPATNTWQQKADYPPGPRLSAVGFAIGNRGYAGTGLDEFLYPTGDFYEYDPVTNSWTTKATFAGVPMFAASAAVVGGKGYVCFGDDWDPMYVRHNELWEYNPVTDTWTAKSPCPGNPRRDAVGFAIGSKAYFGTGNDDSYFETVDFWEYTPATNSWAAKADFAGSARSQAAGFAVNGKGYVGTGGQLDVQDFFEYDPATNSWRGVNPFEGAGRENAASMVIGNRGYVLCGTSGINYRDVWEFNPFVVTGITENNISGLKIYPQPMADESTVELPPGLSGNDMTWELFSMEGKLQSSGVVNAATFRITKGQMPAGSYLLKIEKKTESFTLKNTNYPINL
jgi:N-acetylneuraminic acid mutarotase